MPNTESTKLDDWLKWYVLSENAKAILLDLLTMIDSSCLETLDAAVRRGSNEIAVVVLSTKEKVNMGEAQGGF